MIAASAFLLLAAVAKAQTVLFEGSDYHATVYYDLDEYNGKDICAASNGGPFASNWAIDTGINDGVTYCQGDSTTAWTLKSLDSNRIVAMDHSMVSADRSKWCGKEVQIFGPDGKEITIDEGPFVLFDACAACVSDKIIDLSAKAFAAVKGGDCGGNNPTGLTIKVIDNAVSPSGRAGGGSPASPPQTTATQAAPTTTSTAAPAPASTSTAAPEAAQQETSIRGSGAWWNKDATASAATAATATAIPNGVLEAVAPSAAAPTAKSAAIPEASKDAQVAAGSACEYGKWSCEGKEIQVCSYGDNGLTWLNAGSCDNACQVSGSGSITCV